MLHRELTESATAKEAAEVTSRHFDAHLSANRMCEVGMDHATAGRGYYSVLLALERATRPEAERGAGAAPVPRPPCACGPRGPAGSAAPTCSATAPLAGTGSCAFPSSPTVTVWPSQSYGAALATLQ